MALRWLIKLSLGLSGTRGLAKKHTACSWGHNAQGASLINVKYLMHAFCTVQYTETDLNPEIGHLGEQVLEQPSVCGR